MAIFDLMAMRAASLYLPASALKDLGDDGGLRLGVLPNASASVGITPMSDIDHFDSDTFLDDPVDDPELAAPSGITPIKLPPQGLADALRVLCQPAVQKRPARCGNDLRQVRRQGAASPP